LNSFAEAKDLDQWINGARDERSKGSKSKRSEDPAMLRSHKAGEQGEVWSASLRPCVVARLF